MNVIDVGIKIATARKAKGMTQKELAQILHVTDKAVSKWERGLNFPDLPTLIQLVDVLGIPVEELLDLQKGKTESTLKEFHENLETSQIEKALRKKKRKIIVAIILCAYCGIAFVSGLVKTPNAGLLSSIALGIEFLCLGGIWRMLGIDFSNLINFWVFFGCGVRLILQLRDRKCILKTNIIPEKSFKRIAWIWTFWIVLIVGVALRYEAMESQKGEDDKRFRYVAVQGQAQLDEIKEKIPATDINEFGRFGTITHYVSDPYTSNDLVFSIENGDFDSIITHFFGGGFYTAMARDTSTRTFPVILGYTDACEILWGSGEITTVNVDVEYYEAKTAKKAQKLAATFKKWDEKYTETNVVDMKKYVTDWEWNVDYHDYYVVGADETVLVLCAGERVLKVSLVQAVESGQGKYIPDEEWIPMYIEAFLAESV